jgi:ribosomal-protein-alanine N-acetyltransferase
MPTIRNAREDEALELAAIGVRAWESAIAGWIDANLMRDNALRAFVEFTKQFYLSIDVAEKGGQILGWAARQNLDNAITDLWVDPIWQRQGVGGLLLQQLEQEIREQEYDRVTVETHSQNGPALAFLKNRGYQINWMTAVWSDKLDRDVDTVGLVKILFEEDVSEQPYGQF